MFDFFINYMIFCAKDPSKLFLGTLALFLFVFFGIMFFICEGVFLYVLL
ncbi:membrane protein, partial [Campylobacter coli]